MANTKHAKVNITFCAAVVLLFLTLVTTHFTGGLYARYAASDNAQDSARVASFDVEIAGEILSAEPKIGLVPGENDFYFTVNNKSEVDINVVVTVQNKTDNIPLSFCIYEDGATATPLQDSFTFSDSIDTNSSDGYYLRVVVPQENAVINMLDLVDITIVTEQID